jgi:uncharacterized surface protein with fasciclin (FAS1) repeats
MKKILATGFGMTIASAAFAQAAPSAPQSAPTPVPATAAPATAAPATDGTLISVIRTDPELSMFAKLAEAAGFATTFGGSGPMTLFAPSNAAFAKLPPDQLAQLQKPENVAQLQQIILYHVVPAAAPSTSLKGTAGDVPSAKADAKLKVDGTGDALKVNGAAVVRADVAASNGTVHVIDTVLMPPAA